MYICNNEKFVPEEQVFDSVEAFQAMCRDGFGSEVELRPRNVDELWEVDEHGDYTGTEPVLRLVAGVSD